MEHVKALLIKFVMCTAILFIVLGLFYEVPFGTVFTLSLIVTAAAYVIGDLFILPNFGNGTAVIADFGLAFGAIWVFGALLIETGIEIVLASLISAAIIAVGEWFFHNYMEKEVLSSRERRENAKELDFSTELGEETDVHDLYDPERTSDKYDIRRKK